MICLEEMELDQQGKVLELEEAWVAVEEEVNRVDLVWVQMENVFALPVVQN